MLQKFYISTPHDVYRYSLTVPRAGSGRNTGSGPATFCNYQSEDLDSRRPCWGSVIFWCGSGSPDPYLWLIDPDPTPDPTPFFSDFKDVKNLFFFIFFSYNLPTCTSSSVFKLNLLGKNLFACITHMHIIFSLQNEICCKKLFLHALFQSTQHIYERKEGPEGPKTCGSCGSVSGSPTPLAGGEGGGSDLRRAAWAAAGSCCWEGSGAPSPRGCWSPGRAALHLPQPPSCKKKTFVNKAIRHESH